MGGAGVSGGEFAAERLVDHTRHQKNLGRRGRQCPRFVLLFLTPRKFVEASSAQPSRASTIAPKKQPKNSARVLHVHTSLSSVSKPSRTHTYQQATLQQRKLITPPHHTPLHSHPRGHFFARDVLADTRVCVIFFSFFFLVPQPQSKPKCLPRRISSSRRCRPTRW